MAEVFAFVAFRPCGCACQAATQRALGDAMKTKHFREQMAAGKVRAVMNREEWMAIPWNCDVCKWLPIKRRSKS